MGEGSDIRPLKRNARPGRRYEAAVSARVSADTELDSDSVSLANCENTHYS